MMPGPAKHVRSPLVGDIRVAPPGAEPPGEALAGREQEQVPMLIELNALFPGGLATVRERFSASGTGISTRPAAAGRKGRPPGACRPFRRGSPS